MSAARDSTPPGANGGLRDKLFAAALAVAGAAILTLWRAAEQRASTNEARIEAISVRVGGAEQSLAELRSWMRIEGETTRAALARLEAAVSEQSKAIAALPRPRK